MRRVERLTLSRVGWGDKEGKLEGELTLSAPSGKITITLNHERALRILDVVADQIVETARDTAHIIASDILSEEGTAIEDRSQ